MRSAATPAILVSCLVQIDFARSLFVRPARFHHRENKGQVQRCIWRQTLIGDADQG